MLKNRKSDSDATLVRHSVAEDADEIIEHVLNANMLSMPYHVYSDLFDSVDCLAVDIEKLQAENDKLRELAARAWRLFTEHGAVHPSDLSEVDAVRDEMRELGVEV